MPETTTNSPKTKKIGRFFLFFLIILVVGLAVFNYYLWQYLANLQQHIHQQTSPLNGQIANLRKQLQIVSKNESENKKILQSIETLNAQVETLTQHQEQLTDSVQELMRQPHNRRDWLLTEIVYLLTIADYRLVLMADLDGALTALTLAEQRFQQFNNPAVLSVRKQLTQDLEKLRAVKRPDVGGLAIHLSQFIARADSLPLLQSQYQPRKMTKTHMSQAETLPEAVWQQFKQMVVIRYNPQAETGFLTAEQSYFIGQNLRLQLESARLSLLHQDSKNLGAAISVAQDWLNRYYDKNAKEVLDLQKFLTDLNNIKFIQEFPTISVTLQQLQQLIEKSSTLEFPTSEPTPQQEHSVPPKIEGKKE